MLSSQESVKLLAEYAKGAAWARHCFAVADAAVAVGRVLERNNVIDRSFLWSAALLHDIGRHITHDPLLHGVEGYKLLAMLGYEKEAYICASHILFGLSAAEAAALGLPDRDFVPRTLEEKLVPLVDYMIDYDKPTTLDRRFLSLRKRNAGNSFFLSRLERAHESARIFMVQIEQETGQFVERIISSREDRR